MGREPAHTGRKLTHAERGGVPMVLAQGSQVRTTTLYHLGKEPFLRTYPFKIWFAHLNGIHFCLLLSVEPTIRTGKIESFSQIRIKLLVVEFGSSSD